MATKKPNTRTKNTRKRQPSSDNAANPNFKTGEIAAICLIAIGIFFGISIYSHNGGVLGDASFQAADGAMVGPTSTAVGAAMLQAIVCRVKEMSLAEGFEADFFKSSNVDGGDEWNDQLIARYQDTIPGLY